MAASPRARLTKIQESGDVNGDIKMVMVMMMIGGSSEDGDGCGDDDGWWRW